MTAGLTMAAIAALLLTGTAAQAAGTTAAPAAATAVKAQPSAVHAHRAAPPTAAPDGAVASLVNVEGLRPGQLVLSGRILADIYMGRITMWDAPQIARWNPGVALPHAAIVVVRRDDASPTSFAFTSFLAAQSEVWRKDGGPAGLVPTISGQGMGDADVASMVRRTQNSIGYVDYGFAAHNSLPVTKVITREGVSPILSPPKFAGGGPGLIAPMRAVGHVPPPTLGKLSFIANPPGTLGQMGKVDGPFGGAKSDDPN